MARTITPENGRRYPRSARVNSVVSTAGLVGFFMVATPVSGSAHFDSTSHPATPAGATLTCPVLVPPGSWPGAIGAAGAGVYVCNNLGGGPAPGQGNVQVTTFGNPPSNSPWQCTELAGRFWQSENWPLGSVFSIQHAYQIWTQAQSNPSVVSTVANGSVTASNVSPGDLIVVSGSSQFPDGHVAIVTQVFSDHLTVVDQNYGGGSFGDYGTGTYNLSAGKLTRSGDSRAVLGVVHNLSDNFGKMTTAAACFVPGVNGGTTGSGKLEVHCAYGAGFSTRGDWATPYGYISSTKTAPLFFTNIDGDSALCFVLGVNGGTTGSGKLEVHCAYGAGFGTRGDWATPYGYISNTKTAPLFFTSM
jgi:CHAP domain